MFLLLLAGAAYGSAAAGAQQKSGLRRLGGEDQSIAPNYVEGGWGYGSFVAFFRRGHPESRVGTIRFFCFFRLSRGWWRVCFPPEAVKIGVVLKRSP